jgi:7,8-dihydropterin-6-yl-methyl-4-(beta-D-ribofuranosyl)aminobenzene 5'-phosphate synthase
MTLQDDFGRVHSVSITILVDNYADLILTSSDTVKRYEEKPLLAEHGFSALVDINQGETRILWDTGLSRLALMENLKNLEIDPNSIHIMALSHGHDDHTGAVAEFLRSLRLATQPKKWPSSTPLEDLARASAGRRIPLVLHPACLREIWNIQEDGARYGPILPPPVKEWEAFGAEIVLSEGPHQLAPGCWTTGYIPRRSFEHSGRSRRMQYRQGTAFLPHDIEDDQSIVLNLEGKGLVVLTGCAHAGIVNTVTYARQVSGVERVHAILGGFHLARAQEDERKQTIDVVEEMHPAMISPMHCSGPVAISEFAQRMPQAFVRGAVGTTYLF